MKNINKELIDWAINKIQKEYPEDVSLLIGHNNWKIKADGDEVALNFFIPATEQGYSLAKTFIIDEIGYDLFPMSWARVEGLANINEGITTCLADGVILYARSEEEKQRFIDLQNKLQENLKNSSFIYKKGLEKINIAMDLYKNMVFEESLGQVRKASGYITEYLSQAIATLNGTYFERGPENQIEVLDNMKYIPEQFTFFYQGIVKAETIDVLKKIAQQLISVTRTYFMERAPHSEIENRKFNFEDLAAWYEEGKYTFRRIYYYCDQKDVFNSFAWGFHFQQEFDSIQAEFGLKPMDIMSVYNPKKLEPFRIRTEEIEQYIASEIRNHGVKLREYSSLEEFLKVN